MKDAFFLISGIQKKMDSNNLLRATMKGVGILIVFTIFFCSLNQANNMKLAWILSILLIFILFAIEVYYAKQNKKYEFEIYKITIEDLENKKEIAEIRGEILTDAVLNRKIKAPSNEISLPILYYGVLFFLDVIVRIVMID